MSTLDDKVRDAFDRHVWRQLDDDALRDALLTDVRIADRQARGDFDGALDEAFERDEDEA